MTKFHNTTARQSASHNSALHVFASLASDLAKAVLDKLQRADAGHDRLAARLRYDVGLTDRNPDCMLRSAADANTLRHTTNDLLRSI